MKQGTEWTEPGKGATWQRLYLSVFKNQLATDEMVRAAIKRTARHPGDVCTNLRLTGAPLTAEDVKRIAEAK